MFMGVASVIAIVSTVQGMQMDIERVFASLGSNTFMVTRFGFGLTMQEYLERRRRKKLTRDLIPVIEQGCPDCKHVGAEAYASSHLKYGKSRLRWVEIDGQTPNILETQNIDVARGRYLTWEDDRRRARVAFIGSRVAETLFEGVDPIGERFRIGSHEFTVIGIAEKQGGMFGQEMDEYVTIPLSTHQKIYQQPGNPVNLVISSVSLDRREFAMDQTRVVLRTVRRIPYEADDDFTIMTPDAVLSYVNDITMAFRGVSILIPLLSIVVGGIVIMNIMMISVTERTREIGIRKSLGANRRNILTQFLFESLILSVVGGGIGILLGLEAAGAVLALMDINSSPTTLAIGLGFGISSAVGLFFGIYPAMKAARMDPIKALSYE
jgi:putative ABC transport system permease protein